MSQAAQGKMEEYLTAKHGERRTRMLIAAVALLGAAGLVVAAGALVGPMNEIRRDKQIVLSDESLEGLPPDIVLMTQTGTLRALAIDLTFIRLEELKQDGRYYELMQLSDWLCKLVPRYASVWSYSAWNMAYNISVSQYTPEARWMWVLNGIENLRNQGLRYNPKSVTLYKELAWIFYHKIGAILDDYHIAYKRELAVSMEKILGEPPLVVSEKEAIDAFRKIVDAPRSIETWLENDPKARELVSRLRAEKLEPDANLLYFAARHLRTYSDVSRFTSDAAPDADSLPGESDVARKKRLLTDEEFADTADTLLAALRSDVLRNKLNMDIDWMLELMERYGPIEWRSPYGHSLYWSTYGDMKTKGMKVINEADSMNTVRFIFFSLENLARAGHLILEPDFDQPNRSFLQMLPDLRYLKHMHEAYLRYGEEQFADDPRFVEGTSGPNYASGHRNFLLNAIRQLYLTGGEDNIKEAKEYYFYLHEYDREADGSYKAVYLMPFDRFVFSNLFEALDSIDSARSLIGALLERSLRDLADGQVQHSVDAFREAKKARDYYMRETGTDPNARRKMESIGIMRRDAARFLMTTPIESMLQKHRMWVRLDKATRQAIYDDIKPIVEKYCNVHKPPLVLEKVLPEPPNMAEHRKNPDNVLRAIERMNEDVATGEKVIDE